MKELREQFEKEMGIPVSKASLMYAEWLEDLIRKNKYCEKNDS